jgi:hypothetical protein
LLSLPVPPDSPALNLSSQRQKQKMQEVLVAWFIEEAEQRAVYAIWEDLHWADSSTLEVLGLFLDQLPTARILAVLQQQGQVQAEVEACFQQAIAVVQQQSAKSWELRAAISLARLWQQQGKTTEARDLLTLVYDWFTEGFDTADLREAKGLIDALQRKESH